MPLGARLEGDIEVKAAISVNGVRGAAFQAQSQTATKVSMRILIDQVLVIPVPLGFNVAAANESSRAHFKDIGEITADQNYQIKANRVAAIVVNVDIFVQRIGQRTRRDKSNRAGCDFPVFGYEMRIHQACARGVIHHGARIQQGPAESVDI